MASETRAGIVVIGIGNALRGDDAAGIEVVRRLSRHAGVRVLEHSGEPSGLVEALRAADAAWIVDAAAGGRPGTLTRLDAAAQPLPEGVFACSTHGLGVTAGIELARALGALPSPCVVYALHGARFDAGTPMTAEVEAALPAAAARIEAEIEALQHA